MSSGESGRHGRVAGQGVVQEGDQSMVLGQILLRPKVGGRRESSEEASRKEGKEEVCPQVGRCFRTRTL